MKFRNFKMVDYVVYGRGSVGQLNEIICPGPQRGKADGVFGESFFKKNPLMNRMPLRGRNKVIFADVTYEPETTQVALLTQARKQHLAR